MFARPGLRFRPHERLLADRIAAAVLAEHPAAGRCSRGPGDSPRGRAATGSERPKLADFALTLVRWVRDGRPFGQGGLAAAVGLSRPTVCLYMGIVQRRGLVVRVDDDGRPVAHGTSLPKGTAARYQLDETWTPELVAAMPADWRPRAALAWACLRLGADDQLVAGCLRRSPASNGDRVLWAWLGRAKRARHGHRRRRERAREAAVVRADRGADFACPAGTDADLQELGYRNSTPPETEPAQAQQVGLLSWAPIEAPRRPARAVRPPAEDPSWLELDRDDVADRLVETITEGVELRAEVYAVAEQLGERRPDAAWRQARNVARRCGVRLAAVVGEFTRAADRTRCDVSARVRAELRAPVACPAAFAWGIARRSFGLGPGRTRHAGRRVPRPAAGEWRGDLGDLVVEQPVSEVSGRLPLYVPEPEPERRLTPEEMRAIRARKEAEYRASMGSTAGAGE